MKRNTVLTAACALAAIAGSAGVALAAAQQDRSERGAVERPAAQQVLPTRPEVKRAFPTFNDGPSVADAASQRSLRDQLGAPSEFAHGRVGVADFRLARSSSVAGASSRAWLAPSGDEVCAVLEATDGGYAATCHTLRAISEGKGWVALGPGPKSSSTSVTVAVLVPAGGEAPVVERADGAVRRLDVDGAIAAAALSVREGDSLVVGPAKVRLDAFVGDSKP